jgi:hypothetical protein
LLLKLAGEIIVIQQDFIFHGTMPTLNLTLCLGAPCVRRFLPASIKPFDQR